MPTIQPELQSDASGRSRLYLHEKYTEDDGAFIVFVTDACRGALLHWELKGRAGGGGGMATLNVLRLSDEEGNELSDTVFSSPGVAGLDPVGQSGVLEFGEGANAAAGLGAFLAVDVSGAIPGDHQWTLWLELRG
jgi:hypothetical protein